MLVHSTEGLANGLFGSQLDFSLQSASEQGRDGVVEPVVLAFVDLDLESVESDLDTLNGEGLLRVEVGDESESNASTVSGEEDIGETFVGHLRHGVSSVPEANVSHVGSDVVQSEEDSGVVLAGAGDSVEVGLLLQLDADVVGQDVIGGEDDVVEPVVVGSIGAFDSWDGQVVELLSQHGHQQGSHLAHDFGVEGRSSVVVVVDEVGDEDLGVLGELLSERVGADGVEHRGGLFHHAVDDIVVGEVGKEGVSAVDEVVELLDTSLFDADGRVVARVDGGDQEVLPLMEQGGALLVVLDHQQELLGEEHEVVNGLSVGEAMSEGAESLEDLRELLLHGKTTGSGASRSSGRGDLLLDVAGRSDVGLDGAHDGEEVEESLS